MISLDPACSRLRLAAHVESCAQHHVVVPSRTVKQSVKYDVLVSYRYIFSHVSSETNDSETRESVFDAIKKKSMFQINIYTLYSTQEREYYLVEREIHQVLLE